MQQSKGIIRNVQKSQQGFKLVAPDEIKHLPSNYAIFESGTRLAMTRSLGHGTDVPKEQQTHTITASINQRIRIVTCSDGISDMIDTRFHMTELKTYTATQLVKFAEVSWKKEWKYYSTTTKFPDDNWDDSSCVVWEQK
jgi:serine/threonine protein phosphatase PrpC